MLSKHVDKLVPRASPLETKGKTLGTILGTMSERNLLVKDLSLKTKFLRGFL